MTRNRQRSSTACAKDARYLILGDCLDVLSRKDFPIVDLVHTSPPYNIDKPYENYTDKLHLEEYFEFVGKLAELLSRKMRDGASLFWQTGYTQAGPNSDEINPIDMLTFPYFKQHGFYLKDRIVWRYYGGMSFKSKFKNQHETILWFVRGNPDNGGASVHFDVDAVREKSREPDPRNNLLGRNPGNVWSVDRVAFGSVEQSSHIAVFPEEISERIVRACSKPGDIVLDPFVGSGTVTKVARSLGRRYVGIELSERYFNEASKRLGFQQIGEVDTVLSELLKAYLQSKGNEASFSNCRFFFWQLPNGRATPAEAEMRAWAGGFRGVEDVPKKEKQSLWRMGDEYLDSLPKTVNPGSGLLSNISRAYLSSYKLAKHFNGLRIGLLSNQIRLQIEPMLENEESIKTMLRRVVANEPSSYAVLEYGGDEYIVLKQAERRIKDGGSSKSKRIVAGPETVLWQ